MTRTNGQTSVSLFTLSDLDRRETGEANPSDELGAVSVRDVMHPP